MLKSHKVTLVFAGLIVLFSLGAPVVLANDETAPPSINWPPTSKGAFSKSKQS